MPQCYDVSLLLSPICMRLSTYSSHVLLSKEIDFFVKQYFLQLYEFGSVPLASFFLEKTSCSSSSSCIASSLPVPASQDGVSVSSVPASPAQAPAAHEPSPSGLSTATSWPRAHCACNPCLSIGCCWNQRLFHV